MLSPGQVRDGYNRWAAIYDHDGNPLQALEGPAMVRAIGDVQTLRVLDLGCGTGRHSFWLAQAGARVTAVDFSPGMLEQAKQKPGADTIDFRVHDLQQPLSFASAEFDLIVSGLVLEHLANLDHFFQECRRVLKPGGRAIISTMHPAMFLRGSQARFTDPESGEIIQPGSIAHSIADFVMAILRSGLKIDHLIEQAPDQEIAKQYPRAEKYIGWPMLLLFQLS